MKIDIETLDAEMAKVKAFDPTLNYQIRIGFGEIEVQCFTGTYERACAFMRFCGRQTWDKRLNPEDPNGAKWITSKVTGTRLCFTAFFDNLPPTCRIVDVTERVPKTQTVETGEFIEIRRQKVVCGPEEPQ